MNDMTGKYGDFSTYYFPTKEDYENSIWMLCKQKGWYITYLFDNCIYWTQLRYNKKREKEERMIRLREEDEERLKRKRKESFKTSSDLDIDF